MIDLGAPDEVSNILAYEAVRIFTEHGTEITSK
jgi:hypothetical protein